MALECVEGWKGVDCGMLKKRGYERGGYRNVMEGRKGAGGLGGRAFGRVGISRGHCKVLQEWNDAGVLGVLTSNKSINKSLPRTDLSH